jgi:hypothetical protein
MQTEKHNRYEMVSWSDVERSKRADMRGYAARTDPIRRNDEVFAKRRIW